MFQHLLVRRRLLQVSCGLVILGSGALSEAAVSVTTDHQPVSFGVMELGEEKTLARYGTYQNQVTCSSSNGQPWYVKISALSPFSSLSVPGETIPLERFGWQITWTNGKGVLMSPHQFTPFSLLPQLAYISNADEARGEAVSFQFSYALQMPQAQVSGMYQTTIRITVTELQ